MRMCRSADAWPAALGGSFAASPRSFDHLFEMDATAYTRRPVSARRSAIPTLPAGPSPAAAATRPDDALAAFSPAVRDWFSATFAEPTTAQVEGWAAIAAGRHTLIHAPTGSGKTLAAFLWCLDRLVRDPSPPRTRQEPGHVRVLYVSPLKALSYDVERNLRAPLAGIALAAARRDDPPRRSRSGCAPATRAPRSAASSPGGRPTS